METWIPRLNLIPLPDIGEMKLGIAYFNQGEYDASIESFKAALKHNPELSGALFMLGEAYLKQRKFAEAIEAYREAIRLKPEQPKVFYKLGVAYYGKGLHSDAIEALENALKHDPELAIAYFMLGEVCLKQEKYSEAVLRFKESLRLNPEQPWVYGRLSNAYRALGAVAEARESYKTFVHLRNTMRAKAPKGKKRLHDQDDVTAPDFTEDTTSLVIKDGPG